MADTCNDSHVILILDKYIQMLPWESLPCLQNQSVSRLPSITFLRDRILLVKYRNNDDSSNIDKYLLNHKRHFTSLIQAKI